MMSLYGKAGDSMTKSEKTAMERRKPYLKRSPLVETMLGNGRDSR